MEWFSFQVLCVWLVYREAHLWPGEYVSGGSALSAGLGSKSPLLHTEVRTHLLGCWVFTCSVSMCPTPCDPMDCSPPGSSVHGISPATMLEWISISSSRGSSHSRDGPSLLHLLHWQVDSLPLSHLESSIRVWLTIWNSDEPSSLEQPFVYWAITLSFIFKLQSSVLK